MSALGVSCRAFSSDADAPADDDAASPATMQEDATEVDYRQTPEYMTKRLRELINDPELQDPEYRYVHYGHREPLIRPVGTRSKEEREWRRKLQKKHWRDHGYPSDAIPSDFTQSDELVAIDAKLAEEEFGIKAEGRQVDEIFEKLPPNALANVPLHPTEKDYGSSADDALSEFDFTPRESEYLEKQAQEASFKRHELRELARSFRGQRKAPVGYSGESEERAYNDLLRDRNLKFRSEDDVRWVVDRIDKEYEELVDSVPDPGPEPEPSRFSPKGKYRNTAEFEVNDENWGPVPIPPRYKLDGWKLSWLFHRYKFRKPPKDPKYHDPRGRLPGWSLMANKGGIGMKVYRTSWKYPEPCYFRVLAYRHGKWVKGKRRRDKAWGILTWRGVPENKLRTINKMFKKEWRQYTAPENVPVVYTYKVGTRPDNYPILNSEDLNKDAPVLPFPRKLPISMFPTVVPVKVPKRWENMSEESEAYMKRLERQREKRLRVREREKERLEKKRAKREEKRLALEKMYAPGPDLEDMTGQEL